MKTNDFYQPLSSSQLLENLDKQFGLTVDLQSYSREQLEDIRNKCRTIQFQQEAKAGINDLLTNETYQKNNALLQLLNTRIKEMLGEDIKKLRDRMDQLSEAKKPDANKNDIPDYAEDGKGPNDLEKSTKTSKAKTCSGCKKPINLCGCKGKEKKVKEETRKVTGTYGKKHDAESDDAAPETPKDKKFDTDALQSVSNSQLPKNPTKGKVYKAKESIEKKHAKDCDCKECMQQEGKMPMKKVGGKSVPAFAADGKGKNDLTKKGSAPKKGVNPFAKKKVDESQFKHNVRFVNESLAFLINEDEEGKAKAITAASDIVNDFTSWMQRVGQYQTKAIIELADAIKADFGAAEAETFKSSVAPALASTLEILTAQREAISNAVAVLAGEAAPEEPMGMEPGPEMSPEEPGIDATAPDELNPEAGDEFAAADAAAGAGTTGREMRESREQRFARKLAESHSIIAKLAR
jgi:hypothetical protein